MQRCEIAFFNAKYCYNATLKANTNKTIKLEQLIICLDNLQEENAEHFKCDIEFLSQSEQHGQHGSTLITLVTGKSSAQNVLMTKPVTTSCIPCI